MCDGRFAPNFEDVRSTILTHWNEMRSLPPPSHHDDPQRYGTHLPATKPRSSTTTMSCEAPMPKKPKLEAEEAAEDDAEEEEEGEAPALHQAEKNDDGDSFFALSNTRRCTVRSYRGKTLIDIREVSFI